MCRTSAVQAASGIPLYAGPKRTSNGGSGFDLEHKDDAMVDAYAEAIVDRIGPVLINPALKKYGDTLFDDDLY